MIDLRNINLPVKDKIKISYFAEVLSCNIKQYHFVTFPRILKRITDNKHNTYIYSKFKEVLVEIGMKETSSGYSFAQRKAKEYQKIKKEDNSYNDLKALYNKFKHLFDETKEIYTDTKGLNWNNKLKEIDDALVTSTYITLDILKEQTGQVNNLNLDKIRERQLLTGHISGRPFNNLCSLTKKERYEEAKKYFTDEFFRYDRHASISSLATKILNGHDFEYYRPRYDYKPFDDLAKLFSNTFWNIKRCFSFKHIAMIVARKIARDLHCSKKINFEYRNQLPDEPFSDYLKYMKGELSSHLESNNFLFLKKADYNKTLENVAEYMLNNSYVLEVYNDVICSFGLDFKKYDAKKMKYVKSNIFLLEGLIQARTCFLLNNIGFKSIVGAYDEIFTEAPVEIYRNAQDVIQLPEFLEFIPSGKTKNKKLGKMFTYF